MLGVWNIFRTVHPLRIGRGRLWENAFIIDPHLVPSFDFAASPRVHMSLSLQLCAVTLWTSLSLSPGKIILPSSKPASFIGDRGGEMNKGSKEPFFLCPPPLFFTLSGYIYSWPPWLSTMPHTPITHGRLFHLRDLGWCTCAFIETKPFWHFQGETKNKASV